MKIRNGIQEQNEVTYEGASLKEGDPMLGGESISIAVSENDPSALTRWLVLVWVQLAQGQFFLGGFTTNTSATDGAPARIVGFASCPGAIGWTVRFRNAFPDSGLEFDAEAIIQAGRCCGGSQPPGVIVPPQPPGCGDGDPECSGGFQPPVAPS